MRRASCSVYCVHCLLCCFSLSTDAWLVHHVLKETEKKAALSRTHVLVEMTWLGLLTLTWERYQCFLWHHKGLNPWIVHFSEILQHADPLIQDHSCCKHTTTVIAGLTARGRGLAGRKSSGEDRPVLSHCPHAPVCLFLRLWEPLQLASLTHILFASFSTARMSLPLFVTRPPFLILAVWLYNRLLENRRLTNLFGSGLETYFPNIMWWLKLT